MEKRTMTDMLRSLKGMPKTFVEDLCEDPQAVKAVLAKLKALLARLTQEEKQFVGAIGKERIESLAAETGLSSNEIQEFLLAYLRLKKDIRNLGIDLGL